MLGIKLGGDPQSTRELATWLRDDVAAKADAAEAAARWARNQLGEDGIWWEAAADTIWQDLDRGARKTAAYADKVRRLAGQIEEAADQLAYAKELLAEVPREAELGRLEHTDEYVRPPAPHDDLGRIYEGDPATLSPDTRAQIFNERQRHYLRCEELVEQAAQVILDQMEKLAQANEFDWVPVHFAAGSFVSDETVEVAKWYGSKRLSDVSAHGRWGVFWAEQAAKSGGVAPLQDALLHNASEDARHVNTAARHVRATGVIMRVMRPIGPLLNVPAVIYDIHSGYSGRRAIFTAASGTAAGLAAVGLMAALFTPPGWVLAVGGAVAGVVVGQKYAPEFYDEHIASSKERLLQQPNAPDLSPGPSQLPNQ